jgi:hexosaminidase
VNHAARMRFAFIMCLVAVGICAFSDQVVPINLPAAMTAIPRPARIDARPGFFELTPDIVLSLSGKNAELEALARYLAGVVHEVSGFSPGIGRPSSGRPVISLKLTKMAIRSEREGYRLEVKPGAVKISAAAPAGLFYGIQTLRQMLQSGRRIPCAVIEDFPRFSWRGMLLDCCRHFMSVDLIKRYIDLLAYHKMNVFHWHLTEDQGWRLEIKRYPKLVEIGAWRMENGRRYGGFYTQAQVSEIVAYAKSRYVTVVPEIEMPGHAMAALASYPELGCFQKPLSVETNWGIFNEVLCPGKETTFRFVQNVLDEVCELFPSTFIHIGGDECPKHNWKSCPDCQRRIREQGLKNENELQGYFTRRIDKYMLSKGRRIIGWDEILEGGVDKTSVVQSWRGLEGAVAAAKQGNRVISSPWEGTYILCPQVPEEMRVDFQTLNSLEKAYAFDPVPAEISPAQGLFVMGGECCLWAEYTEEFEVDPQMFPRLCAISEAVWGQRENRDFENFRMRLQAHLPRLETLGVDAHKPETKIGGWTGDDLSHSPQQPWWDVTPFVKGDGIYRFSFVQNSGEDEVILRWAALYEDGREIGRSVRFGRSRTDQFMKCPIRVVGAKPGAVYTLRASLTGPKNNPKSDGTVWLRVFRDDGVPLVGD